MMNTFMGFVLGILMLIGLVVIVAPVFGEDEIATITIGDTTGDLAVTTEDVMETLRYVAGLPMAATTNHVGETFKAVPRCQEDEIVHGIGQFNERWPGLWDSYRCIHPDVVTCDTMFHYLGVVLPYQGVKLTTEQGQFITTFETHLGCTWED